MMAEPVGFLPFVMRRSLYGDGRVSCDLFPQVLCLISAQLVLLLL